MATWFRRSCRRDGSWTSPRPRVSSDRAIRRSAASSPVNRWASWRQSGRRDLEDIVLYTGLLQRPYALVQNPAVRVVSGFFGPVERMARAAGARVSYLPADFEGLERLGLRLKPRVALAVTSAPDRDGWLSFGVQAGASYRPFVEAAADPERLAIAEVNPRMPRIDGIPAFGRNRVHLSEVDAWVEHETELATLLEEPPSPAELAIARRVCGLIETEA